jgi:fatty-acid peroxygenase
MTGRGLPVPRLAGFDHTLAFLHEGYNFISRRCAALGTNAFRARIMLSPVLCARGSAAAQFFYDGDRFTRRRGAMPPTVLRLLQDKGSVQQLDGAAHRHRKALFVDILMGDEAEATFLEVFRAEWAAALDDWTGRREIVLFDEANRVLTRAVCRWTGVPLDGKDDARMAYELSSMIENAGSIGPSVIAALARRRRTERFVRGVVRRLRKGDVGMPQGTPAARIVQFVDHDGRPLSAASATVEIINILRPTVAVGRYIMFAAMALHDHPVVRQSLHGADDTDYERFAEEVRRLYPFFPVVGGIARGDFDWNGHRFSQGDWMLLDLHGTNHDPRRFPHPDAFDPARAPSWRAQGHDFVPQGGGAAHETHRCPGEQLTVAILREAVRMLVEEMEYTVPRQDLSMPLNQFPAKPRSGMILAEVRRRPPRRAPRAEPAIARRRAR